MGDRGGHFRSRIEERLEVGGAFSLAPKEKEEKRRMSGLGMDE